MVSMKKLGAWTLSLVIVLWVAGCGTVRPDANSWHLPKKESAGAGMLIGRLDFPHNATENPDNAVLNLQIVEFRNEEEAVRFGDAGEKHYIMDNNYFVVPNLKPGIYRLTSFRAGKAYHNFHFEEGYKFEVKPGQIKFVGSYDYLRYDQSFWQKMGKRFDYEVRKAQKPTELEMLQWLNKTSAGSGWEPAIKKRILELGGRP